MADDLRDASEQWPVEGSEDLYRSELPFALRADVVRRPSGPDGQPDDDPFTRVVLEHPGAVVILAVDDEERVLCLRQYRHPARMRMLELPAGLLDQEGEEPLAAAERELLEEGGLAATDWTALTSAYSSPGVSSELIHYFLARGLAEVGPGDFVAAHEEADMERLWVPYGELVAACLDGRVHDAPLLVAVLTARQRGLVVSAGVGG